MGAKNIRPCDGEIITAFDGYKERRRVHLVSDLFVVFRNAFAFDPAKDGLQSVTGNYVIMRCSDNVYAGFAHMQRGSVKVSAGQYIKKGDVLGNVGHSGNSTAPHLHFQLMDSSDMFTAKGIPFVFEHYELFRDDGWKKVYKSVPADNDRIRFNL